jgi:processive 1,2-diacylglycerol beta-glucosyltransferase
MIHLCDQDTGARVGTITEDQLRFLIHQLQEESPHDTGYYIRGDTLELFEHNEADPAFLAVLRTALGTRDDMEIRWERR